MLPAQPNQSLMDGLDVLEAVLAANEPIGGRELSRELSLNRTRTNRLLMTLAHLGLLARDDTGKYTPGTGIHVLAALGERGSGLLQAVLPHARNWWERGYGVTVGVLWRKRLCHLLHVMPDKPFDTAIGGRGIVPPTRSSAGLALALSDPKLYQQLCESTDIPPELAIDGYRDILSLGKKRGYVVLPYRNGIQSIGVPIGSPTVAGMSVSRPGLTASDIAAVADELHQIANELPIKV